MSRSATPDSIESHGEHSTDLPPWWSESDMSRLRTRASDSAGVREIASIRMPLIQYPGWRAIVGGLQVSNTEMAQTIQPGWTLGVSLDDGERRFIHECAVIGARLHRRAGGLPEKHLTVLELPGSVGGGAPWLAGVSGLGEDSPLG